MEISFYELVIDSVENALPCVRFFFFFFFLLCHRILDSFVFSPAFKSRVILVQMIEMEGVPPVCCYIWFGFYICRFFFLAIVVWYHNWVLLKMQTKTNPRSFGTRFHVNRFLKRIICILFHSFLAFIRSLFRFFSTFRVF